MIGFLMRAKNNPKSTPDKVYRRRIAVNLAWWFSLGPPNPAEDLEVSSDYDPN